MSETIDLWEKITHKGKADFAEDTKLWTIHMDANG